MGKWLGAFVDRLCVVAGALVFSQAPQYFSQYTQRLAGHVDEIKIHTASIRYAAEKSGKELIEYVQKFSLHQDLDVSLQGDMMQRILNRQIDLSQTYLAMQESTPFSRPFVFFKHFNPDIAKATLVNFHPGLVFTTEGLIYAVIGMGVGLSLFQLITFMVKKALVKNRRIR